MNKIIRSLCYFTSKPTRETIAELERLGTLLIEKGFEIQTKRVCSPEVEKIISLDSEFASDAYIFGVGSVSKNQLDHLLKALLSTKDTSFNLDLSDREISVTDAAVLFTIIEANPSKTFNFSYVFNNSPSSPFFPSGSYAEDGFSVGLQPTDLSENCRTLTEWFEGLKQAWLEIDSIFKNHPEFLGIDSSVAPLFAGKGSLVNFVKRLGYEFPHSVTTDLYLSITAFLKKEPPKPIGLCGIMFPCLEDFELADEYEKGNFTVERNIYLALHSGLGIDTYPIGVDEEPQRVLEILKLVQGLSNKYRKPLSIRFVSDGRTKIGGKTSFGNQYLKDVVVEKL